MLIYKIKLILLKSLTFFLKRLSLLSMSKLFAHLEMKIVSEKLKFLPV